MLLFQVFGKELIHCIIKVKLVLFIIEAMPLIIFHHVFNSYSPVPQGFNHLVALIDVHPGSLAPCATNRGVFILSA